MRILVALLVLTLVSGCMPTINYYADVPSDELPAEHSVVIFDNQSTIEAIDGIPVPFEKKHSDLTNQWHHVHLSPGTHTLTVWHVFWSTYISWYMKEPAKLTHNFEKGKQYKIIQNWETMTISIREVEN